MVSLALGIATAAATFGVVDAVLLRPLPFADDHRLVFLFSSVPDEGIPRMRMSVLNAQDLERRSRSFESLAAVSEDRAVLLDSEPPRTLKAEFVSANYFATLGVPPLRGQDFGAGGGSADATVALVSEDLWRTELASATSLRGLTLVLDEVPFDVIGVMPSSYRGILWEEVDVWLPLESARTLLGPNYLDDRGLGWLTGVARLAPGSSVEQATRELEDLTVQLESEHPGPNRARRAVAEPLRGLYFGEGLQRALLYLLLGAGCILLLCALNAASLVTSEAIARRRELAVLLALGGERRHVFGLFALPLALEVALAGVLGTVLARVAARWLVGLSQVPPASFTDDYVDARVLLIALAVSLALVLALALVPLLVVRRRRLSSEIREGTRSTRGQLRLRTGLVVLEVGLAAILLVGAGLMLQSVRALTRSDPGFRVDRLVTLDVALQTSRYADLDLRRQYVERLLELLRGEPAFDALAVAGPKAPPTSTILSTLEREGRVGVAAEAIAVYRSSVSPSYAGTLGVPLLAGRDLEARDDSDAPPVVLVSRAVADKLSAGKSLESALGMRLRLSPKLDGDPPEAAWTIVGVVGDVRGRGVGTDATDEHDVYLPFAQAPSRRLVLVARGAGDEVAAASRLREAAAELDPQLARNPAIPMRARFAEGAADQRFGATLVGSLALLALVLTSVGFYGLFHLTVRAREQELGVRLSLGAKPRELLGMILLQGLRLTTVGLAVGLAASLLLHRWIGSFLYGTDASDPLVLAAALAVLIVVAFAGALGPALRAMRIDPARTLTRVE